MRSRSYGLALLTAILVINFADRLVFGVVLQDIKTDLALSDTQLGFLSGIAFAFFYAVMGIPLARWADRGNRITVISLCTVLWSAAVGLCGAAFNFFSLMLMRVGVAVGEAGCYAPSLSYISDRFSRAERPRAVARYMLGWPIALLIGFFSAGWLNELYGWRLTFVLFGLPGLILGPLAWLTLKETRSPEGKAPEPAAAEPGLRAVAATLWRIATFRNIFLCFSVWGFFGQGILQWQPAFFVRSHGLGTGELGTWLAIVQGIGTFVGTYLGGELAVRYARNDERLQLKGLVATYAVLGVVLAAIYAVRDYRVAFAIMAFHATIAGAGTGPLFATIQTLVPPQMRSLAVALMYLFCNLIGLGFGPLAVGVLSDALQPTLGQESLRYTLIAFCPGYLWCAWHLWLASRTVEADIRAAAVEGRVH